MKKILIVGGNGYIGSRLAISLSPEMEVDVIDHNLHPFRDMTQLSRREIEGYSAIILLAGVSSVAASTNLELTIRENVEKFNKLLGTIDAGKKLIYASSASVYGNSGSVPVDENYRFAKPINYYDLSKQIIDKIATASPNNCFGLRFGTVCGYSPKPRLELMINAMVKSAKMKGVIELRNPDCYRAVLGISDLCRAVREIIVQEGPRGVYNLASFNASIGHIAHKVSETCSFKSEVMLLSETPTYSFSIDTTKFSEAFNFRFQQDIKSIVKEAERNL